VVETTDGGDRRDVGFGWRLDRSRDRPHLCRARDAFGLSGTL
jgi:hypothetical protein